ncbi:MAG: hypothetical protein V3U29_01300 [Phycisphaeraceae bacterium]
MLCLCAIVVLSPIAVVATDEAPDDSVLREQRWREQAYGVSLRPPVDARLSTAGKGDGLLRIDGFGRYVIKFDLKHSDNPLDMDGLVRRAMMQITFVSPNAILLAEAEARPAGRPGAILYFKIPDDDRGPWVLGQAFMKLDPTTFAILRLETESRFYEAVRPVFEAVFNSFAVDSPADLDRQRDQLIRRGQAWRDAIGPARLHAALVDDQWFRILENDKDIGYVHIRQQAATEVDLPGVRVDVQARILADNRAYDSLSNFFCSDDDTTEIWSIKTTVRPLTPEARLTPATPDGSQSWAETGLRANQIVRIGDRNEVVNVITVSRESPSSVTEDKWDRPPHAYISLGWVYAMGPLLPHNEPTEMAVYAYSPNTGKVVLRTERIEPASDGSYKVYSRPSPEIGEQITEYDAEGRFIRRTYPNGRIMERTTPAEIEARWRNR